MYPRQIHFLHISQELWHKNYGFSTVGGTVKRAATDTCQHGAERTPVTLNPSTNLPLAVELLIQYKEFKI